MNDPRLDAQAAAYLAQHHAAGLPSLDTLVPADVRALQRTFVARLAGEPERVASAEDRTISAPGGPLDIRIYTPEEPAHGILVYLHGGGWVIGSIETADAACRALARRTPCVVVSVGYRLAPEHRFPAAFEDAAAATRWVASHAGELAGDASRIAIAGDSAGGNLAAAVTLDARDAHGDPALCHQVLIYPVVDFDFDKPAYREFGTGYLLTRDDMLWFAGNYLSAPGDRANSLAAPLRATSLRGLPPALVLQAGCDPLRDDGEAYAARLQAADVPVTLLRYPGMLHGFFTAPGVFGQARRAYAGVARALRLAFAQ